MRALVLFAALLVAGCTQTTTTTTTASSIGKPQMPPDVTTEVECAAVGGKWGPVGLMGTPACTQPSPTANMTCSDSNECAGMCWSTEAVGSKATGYCQPTNMPFGCHSEVVAGVVQPALCAD